MFKRLLGSALLSIVIFSVAFASGPKPDLVVTEISYMNPVAINYLTYTVKNTGNADVDLNDTVVAEVVVTPVSTHAPVTTYHTLNSSLLTKNSSVVDIVRPLDAGDYEVTVCVDFSDSVEERSETNNCRTQEIKV